MEELKVLLAEITGFVILCCAATIEFSYAMEDSGNVVYTSSFVFSFSFRGLNENNATLLQNQQQVNHLISQLDYSKSTNALYKLIQSLLRSSLQISYRLDVIHVSECCGLIILIIVAYGQYRIKLAKQQQRHISGIGHGTNH